VTGPDRDTVTWREVLAATTERLGALGGASDARRIVEEANGA